MRKTELHKCNGKMLYLVEIYHNDWDGDLIHRGIFARRPREAVELAQKIYPNEQGYSAYVSPFKILTPAPEKGEGK